MDGGSVLLHVGYHKTASSVLQSQLFADPGGPFVLPEEKRHLLVERFVVPAPYAFDVGAARAHHAPLLARAAASGKTAVISHERFSGYPPSGGFDGPILTTSLVIA